MKHMKTPKTPKKTPRAMQRKPDRFPSPLKDLRTKFPKGPVVQARMQLEDGATVIFQGALGGPGTDFDKVVAAVRQVCQENGAAPSESPHEGKDPQGRARVDTERGTVRREPVHRESGAQEDRGDRGNRGTPVKHVVLYQGWEESERGWGVRPDGYSLHVDGAHHTKFVMAFEKLQSDFFLGRGQNYVPDEYTRVSGEPVPVNVNSAIYKQLVAMGGNYQGANLDGVKIDAVRNLIAPEKGLP